MDIITIIAESFYYHSFLKIKKSTAPPTIKAIRKTHETTTPHILIHEIALTSNGVNQSKMERIP